MMVIPDDPGKKDMRNAAADWEHHNERTTRIVIIRT